MDILSLINDNMSLSVTVISIVVGIIITRLSIPKNKEDKKPKLLTPYCYPKENTNFIDRSYIFKEIEAKFKKNNILLIYGIGKSSIAIEYINRKKWLLDFKHRYFLAIDSGIDEAFKSLLLDKSKDINLNIILNEIDNKDTLLILDNALTLQREELSKILNQLTKAKIIITSRGKELNISNSIEIEPLSDRESLELFESYFGKVKDENIKNIVTLGNRTPLVLEILAKHTKYYLDTKTPKEILEIFENSQNDNGARIDLGNRGVESIKSLIEGIFNINEIDTNEKKAIMLALANLDPNGVEVKYILKWLQVENETEYVNTIDELLNLGWINKKDSFLKTHRVVIEVIKENIEDEEVIDTLFNSIFYELEPKNDNPNPIDLIEFIAHSKELLKSKFKNENYANLSYNLSFLFRELGNYKEALKYCYISLKIKSNMKVEDKDVVANYENLVFIYNNLEKYEKAFEFSKKAIEIFERLNDKIHLAISYNDLSLIYLSLDELDEALKYQEKAIDLYKKENLDKNHPFLAMSYYNLSLIYVRKYELKQQNDLQKALEYQQQDLEIKEKVLLEKINKDLAKSYTNMAKIHFYFEKYKIAKEYINKAIDIYRIAFPSGHPHLDVSLEWQKAIEAKL